MKLKIRGDLEIQIVDEAKPKFIFDVTYNNAIFKNITMLVLPADQKVLAHITPIDAKGNPAAIQGDPTWTSSSEAIATVSPQSADGSGTYSAWITPATQIGTCQINVTADADLGAGVTTITGLLDLQVAAGEAVGFQIQTDAPVPQKA